MKNLAVFSVISAILLTGCLPAPDGEFVATDKPVTKVTESDATPELDFTGERVLLTFDNMSEYNSPDEPNCDVKFDFSAPETKEQFIDRGRDFYFQVPFNDKWGGEQFRILPYEISKDTVYFGTISGFEACSWVRQYQMNYLPAISAEELIDELGEDVSPEVITVKNADGNDMEVLKYITHGMCSYPAMQIIGKDANYEFTTICSIDPDKDFVLFEELLGTVEYEAVE